ncbi:MAG: oligosaccharide flippase family protein [Anaerolineae bacterium]
MNALRRRLAAFDWSLLRGSSIVSMGMFAARFFAFLFLFLLASVFDRADYGFIQYVINTTLTVAILTMPFTQHVLARFLSASKDDDRQDKVVTNTLVVMAVLIAITLAIALPVLAALNRLSIGIVIIYIGITAFYGYWGLARGALAPGRLVLAYLASNIQQLAQAFLLLNQQGFAEPLLALLIYGLVYFPPIIILQMVRPIRFRPRLELIDRETIRELLKFAVPIWVSHASYTLFLTSDILLLDFFAGQEVVGVYSLAKTFTVVLTFIPGGISTLLMPRIASEEGEEEDRRRRHGDLLRNVLLLSTAVNVVLFIGYAVAGRWVIGLIFGQEYVFELATGLMLAIAQILFGIHGVTTAYLVGSNRPHLETISRFVAVVAMLSLSLILIPRMEQIGAALAVLVGATAALGVYGVIALRGRRPEPEGSAAD